MLNIPEQSFIHFILLIGHFAGLKSLGMKFK